MKPRLHLSDQFLTWLDAADPKDRQAVQSELFAILDAPDSVPFGRSRRQVSGTGLVLRLNRTLDMPYVQVLDVQ